MREILFRGKRADNGEWVSGYYCRAFSQINGKDSVPAIQEALLLLSSNRPFYRRAVHRIDRQKRQEDFRGGYFKTCV